MPWCDPCSEFHASADLDGGRCPSCGDTMTAEHPPPDASEDAPTVGQSAPWHFWLVVVALAGYLLWRFVEFIAWLL